MHSEIDISKKDFVNDALLEEGKNLPTNEDHMDLPLKGRKILNYRTILLCAICFTIFLFLSIGSALGITLPFVLGSTNPAMDEFVLTSTEFQMNLDRNFNEQYRSRSDVIHSLMNYFSHKSKFFSLEDSTESTKTRKQYYLDSKGKHKCGKDWEIRVREYLEDDTSTIDIKGNSHFEFKARQMPFWPSADYESDSSQKCESDKHVCGGDKYSRETRLFLSSWKTKWSSCQDLVEMFPWAYDDLSSEQKDYIPTPETTHYWFVREYSGYLDGNTKYKIAITMQYDSLEDLQDDNAPFKGGSEWSVRVFSLDDGLSPKYNQAVLEDMKTSRDLLANYFVEQCE